MLIFCYADDDDFSIIDALLRDRLFSLRHDLVRGGAVARGEGGGSPNLSKIQQAEVQCSAVSAGIIFELYR